MKIAYQPKEFRNAAIQIIDTANDIIAEYQAQGYSLTLRQLYYQFVARGLIENTEKSYKRLGEIVSDARLAGLIDWYAIEDRTRWLRSKAHWSSPSEIVKACAAQYTVDMWANQDYRPEVWIEKDALVGVIERVCKELDVPHFACRGYVSQSEQWRAGRRFLEYIDKDQIPIVFHFGDHDPSGLDMTRDNGDRLRMFAEMGVQVNRLALTFDQVKQYNPPPNPAKLTDSRIGGYIAEYGESSWELDALEPAVIEALIRDAVETLIDPDRWAASRDAIEEGRAKLRQVVEILKKGN
jgi:hypothetical protein